MAIFLSSLSQGDSVELFHTLHSMRKSDLRDLCILFGCKIPANENKFTHINHLRNFIEDHPVEILSKLDLEDLTIIDEMVQQQTSTAVRPIPSEYNNLQLFGLVATYEDLERQEWHYFMDEYLLDIFSDYYKVFQLHLTATGQHLTAEEFDALVQLSMLPEEEFNNLIDNSFEYFCNSEELKDANITDKPSQ